MRLSDVKMEDGRMCVQLIKLLATGRWDLSGADAEAMVATKRWVQALAADMGEQLKGLEKAPAEPSSTSMKVKAMGPIGGSMNTKKKRK